jgi:hypothetical protein
MSESIGVISDVMAFVAQDPELFWILVGDESRWEALGLDTERRHALRAARAHILEQRAAIFSACHQLFGDEMAGHTTQKRAPRLSMAAQSGALSCPVQGPLWVTFFVDPRIMPPTEGAPQVSLLVTIYTAKKSEISLPVVANLIEASGRPRPIEPALRTYWHPRIILKAVELKREARHADLAAAAVHGLADVWSVIKPELGGGGGGPR